MKIYKYPTSSEWTEITERPHLDVSKLNDIVAGVLSDIKLRGDQAVKEYELKFDHAALESLAVSAEEMEAAKNLISKELKDALVLAHNNIAKFHQAQTFKPEKIETCPEVGSYRKGWTLYSRRYRSPLFYGINACHSR